MFPSRIDPTLVAILARVDAFMQERQTPCYLVGGWIRDQLLNRPVSRLDVDLTMSRKAIAHSRDLAKALKAAFVLLDEENGCARVVISKEEVRIVLDFSDFRASTIEGDLSRRDFTVNAIAVALTDWVREPANPKPLIDPLGGEQAIREKKLIACFAGAFKEDPVRILRAGRFSAQLSFRLDASLPALMAEAAPRLSTVSAERVRDELMAIFETDKAFEAICLLNDAGALDVILPELSAGRGLDQGDFHHLDVLRHQFEAVAQADRFLTDFIEFSEPLRQVLGDYCAQELVEHRSRKGLIKLSALLHDIGKPHCRQVHPDGEIWFLGHEHAGAAFAEKIVQRLRLSNRESEMVCQLVLHHLRPGFLSRESQLTRRAIYRFFKDLGDHGPACLLEWWADRLATRGKKSRLDQIDQHRQFLEEMLRCYFFKAEAVVRPKRLVDGHQLMAAFGLKPSPRVGELLDMIEEAQAEGRIGTSEQALALAKRHLHEDNKPCV